MGSLGFDWLDFTVPRSREDGIGRISYLGAAYQNDFIITLPYNLEFGDYRIEVDARFDSPEYGGGSARTDLFRVDIERIEMVLSEVSVANPVIEQGDDAWFAIDIENRSTIAEFGNYDLSVSMHSLFDDEPSAFTGEAVIENIAPDDSSREIYRIKTVDLSQDLEPGTYEVSFSVATDLTNGLEYDTSNNSNSTYVFVKPENPGLMARASKDFDGDRVEDVLFFNTETRAVGQFVMPTGDWSSLGRAGAGWVAKGTGHFDSDDDAADILWFNENTRNVGRFDLSESGSNWGGLGKAGIGWEVAGAGDFNGDGTDDILWLNTITNAVGQFRVNDGTPAWQGIGRSGSAWELSGIGDFNSDGVDDLLWYNTETGALGQFVMSESGMSWAQITTLGQGYRVAAIGDFDQDGTDDILVLRESSREVGAFFMTDGTASWGGTVDNPLETGRSIEGVGDFDGDGADELMVRDQDGTISRIVIEDDNFAIVEVGTAGTDWDVLL